MVLEVINNFIFAALLVMSTREISRYFTKVTKPYLYSHLNRATRKRIRNHFIQEVKCDLIEHECLGLFNLHKDVRRCRKHFERVKLRRRNERLQNTKQIFPWLENKKVKADILDNDWSRCEPWVCKKIMQMREEIILNELSRRNLREITHDYKDKYSQVTEAVEVNGRQVILPSKLVYHHANDYDTWHFQPVWYCQCRLKRPDRDCLMCGRERDEIPLPTVFPNIEGGPRPLDDDALELAKKYSKLFIRNSQKKLSKILGRTIKVILENGWYKAQ